MTNKKVSFYLLRILFFLIPTIILFCIGKNQLGVVFALLTIVVAASFLNFIGNFPNVLKAYLKKKKDYSYIEREVISYLESHCADIQFEGGDDSIQMNIFSFQDKLLNRKLMLIHSFSEKSPTLFENYDKHLHKFVLKTEDNEIMIKSVDLFNLDSGLAYVMRNQFEFSRITEK